MSAKQPLITLFYLLIPFSFVVGLIHTLQTFNMRLSVALLVAVNLILLGFLVLLLRIEGAVNLPFDLGKIATGPAYVMSVASTLFLIFVFITALATIPN